MVEGDEDLIETKYCNGNNEVVKFLNQIVLFVTKEKKFMFLGNAAISVFASNVIEIKVILIYPNVLFVERNKERKNNFSYTHPNANNIV